MQTIFLRHSSTARIVSQKMLREQRQFSCNASPVMENLSERSASSRSVGVAAGIISVDMNVVFVFVVIVVYVVENEICWSCVSIE